MRRKCSSSKYLKCSSALLRLPHRRLLLGVQADVVLGLELAVGHRLAPAPLAQMPPAPNAGGIIISQREVNVIFIWDFVASTILDELLDWAYSQAVGFLGAFFALMGNMGVELFDLPWVQAMVTFFNQLGWALFGVSLVVSGFEFGIEYSSGRGNLRHTAINCLKGFMAVGLFSTVPVRLYALSVSLQASFTAGITGLGTSIGAVGQNIIIKLTTPGGLIASGVDFIFGGPSFNPIMMLFCVILMAYAVIKVFFRQPEAGRHPPDPDRGGGAVYVQRPQGLQ